MRKSLSLVLATGLLTCLSLGIAHADDRHGHDHDFHDGGWHGRGDIHEFHGPDFDRWRGGHWFHGFHDGHDGWWWEVNGFWYNYPAPVYPYPDPYTPPTVVVEQAAPGVVVTPAYYYCSNPAGYYPYVPQCYGPWQRVASVAPASPPPIAVVAPAPGTRAADVAQLNAYSTELQGIDPHDPQARAHLRDLGKRVDKFRQSLFHRGYNAAEVVKEAEDLQHRIKVEKDIVAHTTQLTPLAPMQAPPVPLPVPVPVPVAPQQ